MIHSLTIENFKSIDQLEIPLGRVNVFIGENGCGKSNILEAVSFGAAAAADKLDNEFLVSRGIRVTDPKLMRAAFKAENLDRPIKLGSWIGDIYNSVELSHSKAEYASWEVRGRRGSRDEGRETTGRQYEGTRIDDIIRRGMDSRSGEWMKDGAIDKERVAAVLSEIVQGIPDEWKRSLMEVSPAFGSELAGFLAYTPQLEALRSLDLDSALAPVGIHGEGLFKLLQVLEREGHLPEIKQQLEMIDWFADLEVFSGPNPAVRELRIRDQYLDSAVAHFDQRSANEGFLFLLLYACLLVSKYTPAFFAVDNIETGLNPKLCAGLIKMFARLTRTHGKQVLLTTHNPGALDGLDLNDDEQRLFVVYRNVDGCTRVRRIKRGDLPAGEQPVRLSEAFLRGYIGGLPTNF